MSTPQTIEQRLARQLQHPERYVAAAVRLFDEGNTVPFVARYRQEQTGGLDDKQLRELYEQLERLRSLETRRDEILALLDQHGHLSDELASQVREADSLQRLEDLYRPYRPKRTTRASVARDHGLEPLAQWLVSRPADANCEQYARQFVSEQVPLPEDALQGARDIIAEQLSDDPELRETLRSFAYKHAVIRTTIRDEAQTKYAAYADFTAPVERIPPHSILAINRGEKEEALSVKIDIQPMDRLLTLAEEAVFSLAHAADHVSPCDEHVRLAAHDAIKRLIVPSLIREMRSTLTERGERQAVTVFRENLRSLLLQPPLRGHVVMGLDPAFRTGVKVAVVDETGRLLATDVVYPVEPHYEVATAQSTLRALTEQFRVTAVAIGNGTASRETERFVAQWLADIPAQKRPAYCIVNEAGASVYSASPLAQHEFPDLDVSERSAVSIARRLQDPLAELVKIEPQALGVGQYQHDIQPKLLSQQLSAVVEATVNDVGVDVNTASVALLSYVAGISRRVAENIVAYREQNGPFRRRQQLLDVPQLGPRTYEQCAGFLQIRDADHPFDETTIHPESYDVAEKLLAEFRLSPGDIAACHDYLAELSDDDIKQYAQRLQCGEPTLRHIVSALLNPGRDPRDDLPPPILRSDVIELDDLRPGMMLQGTVRNVVDFGAFVDIGVSQDGLVHISELADEFIKHPLDVVTVGDIVQVRVLDVDLERQRIALSMRGT